MNKKTFNKFRKFIYEQSGISIGEQKEALLSARIGKRLRALNLPDYDTYMNYLEKDKTGNESIQLLDVISTNVTSFFRESDHFTFLKSVMEKWFGEGQCKLRFWSAACSSGEEPYSIGMVSGDVIANRNIDIKILATDISTRILKKAMTGTYEKINGIPNVYQTRFLTKHKNSGIPGFEIKDSIKNMVIFKRLNLSTPPFPMKGPMDVVFCRNVMIYFDDIVRGKLLTEIAKLLKPGGYLFVGHSESVMNQITSLKVVRPSVYVKK